MRINTTWRQAAALMFAVAVVHALFRVAPHSARIGLAHEDGVFEYLGALSFLSASVLMFLAFLAVRRAAPRGEARLKQLFLLGMAVVFFLAAGEEISWGQRIFGIETPAALVAANRQQETNLHNLGALSFDEYRLFTLFWYPYVLVVPFVAALWPVARRFFSWLVPLVAWPFGLLYVVNDVASWVVGRSLADDTARLGPRIDFPRVELRETLFELLCLLTAYLVLRAVKAATDRSSNPRAARAARSRRGSGMPAPDPSNTRKPRKSEASGPVMDHR